MRKLIVLDLDGTLLRDDKTVSQYTINTLLDIKRDNNIILFATARPPRDVYKYVPEVLKDNPIICYNGACIISREKILYKKQISRDDTLEIVKTAINFSYNKICVEIDDKLYSNFDVSEFFKDSAHERVNFFNMQFEKAYKVIICSKKTISDELVKALPNSCKGIVTDKGVLCQIMNRETSKWSAIKVLAEKLQINLENIIAFGDDYNDYDMIKNAGIGVAMENSEESIKKIADFITDTNNNDGVSKYIRQNNIITLEYIEK